MAKIDMLFPLPDEDQAGLSGFFRKQANEAAAAGLEPHRGARTLQLILSVLQLVLSGGLITLTLIPVAPALSTWLIRATAAIVVVTVVVGMRRSAGLDYKATGFHLRLWTLCERCIELLSQKNDPKTVHKYYLQHRSLLERTRKGTRLLG